MVAVAGSNGAGKSTFYNSQLRASGLLLVNADLIARGLGMDAYAAARVAESVRNELIRQRESFAFETVFSDPVGDKLQFLRNAAAEGYQVVLCFIGIKGPEVSTERVAMRVSQGGHDVPGGKLYARYPRTLANLQAGLYELPHVRIYDNDDLSHPFRLVAVYESGRRTEVHPPLPSWLRPLLPR